MISIIIPNYNGKKHLEICLSALIKQKFKDIEIIVIDNGSSDGSVDFIKNNFPEVKVILSKENLGFAQANNLGAKEAKGEYLLFLNNDTKLKEDCLVFLFNRIKADVSQGVVFSKVLFMDEPDRLDAVGSYLTKTGFLLHVGWWEKDKGQHDYVDKIFSPKGVCFLMRKSLFNKIGGFDKDYFAYFEESDLFWRVWLSGYTIHFVPESICYHKVGGTCTKLPSVVIDYNSFKNRICTLIKNLNRINLTFILPIHLLICLSISFVYLIKMRPQNAIAIYRAIFWNVRNLPETLKKRNFTQKVLRKITDRQLFIQTKVKKKTFKETMDFIKVYLKRW